MDALLETKGKPKMRDAIIQKLSTILADVPRTEAEVVYVFVEVRKLLDSGDQAGEFRTLKFFCDWVVHVRLDRSGARSMLAGIDAELLRSGESVPENVGPNSALYRMISLEPLFEEMKRFCEVNELPRRWTGNPTLWRECMRLYGQVVRDCPLVITGKGPADRYVNELRLTDTQDCDELPSKRCFSWCWQFTLNDGKTFQLTNRYYYPSVSYDASRPSLQEFGI